VERIEARATLIETYDGQRVVIPNSDIYTRAVTVRTAFPKRRAEYDVGVGYGDDLDKACSLIREAVRGIEGVESEPAPEAFPWVLDASEVCPCCVGSPSPRSRTPPPWCWRPTGRSASSRRRPRATATFS
jgi:small-conductance mechanosensitive channel